MSVIASWDEQRGELSINYPQGSSEYRQILHATFIDEVSGIRFYEDPHYGDETGLWAVYRGKVAATDYFSVPDAEEIDDAAEFFECYS